MKVILKLGELNGMWNDGGEKMMRGWWRGSGNFYGAGVWISISICCVDFFYG
jgi:hypothetical protein